MQKNPIPCKIINPPETAEARQALNERYTAAVADILIAHIEALMPENRQAAYEEILQLIEKYP